jgi:DNA-binding CsgD family transcriptional regulator
VFLAASGLMVLAFLLTWLLREVLLRETAAAQGIGESFVSPREERSDRELERIVSSIVRGDARTQIYAHVIQRSGVDLSPAEAWLLGRPLAGRHRSGRPHGRRPSGARRASDDRVARGGDAEGLSPRIFTVETDPALRGSASFLQLVAPQLPPALEEIGVPAYVLDSSGRIRWLNQAAKELVGEAEGQSFTAVIGRAELGDARSRFLSNLRSTGHNDFGLDLVTPDGEERRVEISSVPLRGRHRAIGMFGLAMPRRPGSATTSRDDRLTARQREILGHLANGHSTDQIAAELHLSRETVRNHIRHVLRRLGAKSRLEAVAVARRDGIL